MRSPNPLALLRVLCMWTLALDMGCAAATNLLDIYDQSLSTDPLWQQAQATRLAVQEVKTQAILNLVPINLTANKNWAAIGSTPIDTPAYAALTASVNLFSWSNWVALKTANATVAQAEANYQAAAQNLVLRVAQQYFAVLTAQETLTAQQGALESAQSQLDQAEQRYKVGLIAVTDVETARAARDSSSAAVIAAKRSLTTQQNLLRAITNQSYTTLASARDDMPLLTPDPASEDRWVSTAMSQNATLTASRMAAEIAHDNVESAYGGHVPSVSVSVSRDWALTRNNANSEVLINGAAYGLDTHDLIWQLGVSVPIFSGGVVQSQVRQARHNWDAAKSGLDYTSRQTEEQTRDAYQGIISQIAQVKALRQAVESNRVALEATEAGYKVGVKNIVDVVTARQSLLQARTDYAQAKYGYLGNLVTLRYGAGNLDRRALVQINGWLAELSPAAGAASDNADANSANTSANSPPAPAPAPATKP